jgi:hypothetical protein
LLSLVKPFPYTEEIVATFPTLARNAVCFLSLCSICVCVYAQELTGFPDTAYDDQVDSTTQFLDHHGARGLPMVITPEMLARAAMPTRYSRYFRIPCFF